MDSYIHKGGQTDREDGQIDKKNRHRCGLESQLLKRTSGQHTDRQTNRQAKIQTD